MGTMTTLGVTFALAKQIRLLGKKTEVVLDLWDNAKSSQLTIEGITYQKGLRTAGAVVIPDYQALLDKLSTHFSVSYRIRFEEEFMKQAGMSDVIRGIIRDRDSIGMTLAPSNGILSLRAECPRDHCGLVDKNAVFNIYDEARDCVHFKCPIHGRYTVDVGSQSDRFRFNAQLGGLIIGRYYSNVSYGWLQVMGSDYAGFWTDQMLTRHLKKPIITVYTPYIVDWSGAKLSKSLYLQKDAYKYLVDAGMEYMLSYAVLQAEGKDISVLFDEVETWVVEPFRLFRCYSVHYMHMVFTQKEDIKLGVIHKIDKVKEMA